MSVVVKNNYVGVAPRKVRLVCDLIRKKSIDEAFKVLRFNKKKEIAITLTKLLNSGLAKAADSDRYDLDNLVVKSITVDEGRTLKRIMPRAQGRAFRINKRTSKVTIKLDEA